MATVSLCMIVAPGEGHLLDRCLNSINGHVDEIHITTQEKDKDIINICKKYNAEIHYRDWTHDFAAQRNFSFQFATKDWIMWLDSDDVVKNPHKIKQVLDLTPEEARAVVSKYIYSKDKYGNTAVEQWRERIIRRDSNFKWIGVIHETLIDTNYPKIVKTTDFEIVHEPESGDGKVGIRNLQILNLEIDKQRKSGEEIDPRLVYYLGTTYKSLEMYEDAYRILQAFVKTSGWDEQRYDAYLQMSDIGLAINDNNIAIDNALLATKERPDFPDAYYQLGKAYASMEKWEKCIEWVQMGLSKKPADTDWVLAVREPYAKMYMASAYTNLGKFKEANKVLEEMSKYWPKEKGIKEQIKLNKTLQEQKDLTDDYFRIWKFLKKNKQDKLIKPLFESVPKEIKDNPAILNMKWDSVEPKTWENSIVIYCGESWEPWSPKITEKGIGGSEEAVIELSRELTNLGWNVTVFNLCGGDSGIYDGVEYKNYWEFNPKDNYDVLIMWRTPQFFDTEYNANKKYLWMHDVFPDSAWSPRILRNLDKVIVLSEYHRKLWPSIPDEKIFYFQNGINTSHFNQEVKRIPHKVIYSSCPSRGLEHLLRMWPEVRKEVPDAELHFFYGWDNFIKGNHNYPNRMSWMKEMQELAKQDGIVDRGRIGHTELAKEMLSSDVWAYPCIFPEISCITAMKAQAAGTYPVVIPYAAVDETTQYGDKTDKEHFKDTLVKRLQAPRDDLRKEMSHWALDKFSWLKTAEMLSGELNG